MTARSPVYADSVQGKGANSNRLTLLRHTISRGAPFANMGAGVKAAIEGKIDDLRSQLLESVEKVFDMVLEDFDTMFVVEEVPNPQRDILRQQINEFVGRARAKIDGPIAQEFATAIKDSDR